MLFLPLNCRTHLLELLLSWPELISIKHSVSWLNQAPLNSRACLHKKWTSHKGTQCQTVTQALSQTKIQFLAWNCSKAGYYSSHPPPLTSSHVLRHVLCPTAACWPPRTPHIPRERYSLESHRKYLSSHLQTCSLCTSQSQQFWCAPRCPRGRCLASSLCGGRERNPSFKLLQSYTSYFSRLRLLTCYLPPCSAYMLQSQRKAEGRMRVCSLGLQHPSSSFILSQHWFICCWRFYPRHLLKAVSFEDAE